MSGPPFGSVTEATALRVAEALERLVELLGEESSRHDADLPDRRRQVLPRSRARSSSPASPASERTR
jgi:hypothetical protein